MHAFVTMPFDKVPLKLQKISSVIYYHPETKKLYKSTVLDPITAFIKQDLVSRQNITITEYNPDYLVLQYFDQYNQINVSNIPKYLSIQNYQKFGTYLQGQIITTTTNKKTIKKDDNKILDYLQRRALALLNLLENKGYYKQEQYVKLKANMKNEEMQQIQHRRQLPNIVVKLLQKDIPEAFIDELLLKKFKKQILKKSIMMDTYQEVIVNRQPPPKKKATPKPKPVQIPANQPQLFGFMNKSIEKKKKQANDKK